MDHCTFCGAELPAPARFCGTCGRANITTGEMPTHLSGYAAGNVTVENAPTAITGPARPVIFPTAGRNTRSQGPDTPPVALPGEEPEEERRRRALLLGLPLAAGLVESSTAGVPGVVGTAQPEGVPLVEGNPAGAPAALSPQVAGAMAGGSAAPGAGWIYTPPPSAPSSWPADSPPAASSPAPVPARGTPTAAPAPGGGSCALVALILVIIAAIISASLGIFVFVLPASLSLSGGSVVQAGGSLHVHGSNFLPDGAITLSLDDGLRVAAPTARVGTSGGVRTTAAALDLSRMLNAAPGGLTANIAGSFDINLPVSASWGLGAHTLHASQAFAMRSATLHFSVSAPIAQLVANPARLNFGALSAGTKTVLALALTNEGAQALSWRASAAGATWLSIAPARGGIQPAAAAQFMYVTANTTGLKVGAYSAAITLSADHGAAARVAVNLQVVALVPKQQAILNVTPTTLDFGTLNMGDQATKSITIGDAGTLPLQWSAASGDVGWVTLDVSSQTIQAGTRPSSVAVTVHTGNLAVGSYSVKLTLSSNGGSQQVLITIRVQKPSIGQACGLRSPTPADVNFSANAGTNPADQSIKIAVTGNCVHSVTITPAVNSAAGSADWLSVSPAQATLSGDSATFSMRAAASSLRPGSYSASIELTATLAGSAIAGSPQSVSVALNILEVPPVLALSTASMNFSLSNAAGATARSFGISNTGGSALDWTTKLNAPAFVSLNSAAGNGLAAGASIGDSLSIAPANQKPGTYSATLLVYATDPLDSTTVKGSPASIAVSITITAAPALQLSPTSLSFAPGNCVRRAAQTVALTNAGGGTLSWTVGSPAYPDVQDPGGWLSVAPAGGSGDATLTLTLNDVGVKVISGQTYTAYVTVTPSVGNAQTLVVTFSVPDCLT